VRKGKEVVWNVKETGAIHLNKAHGYYRIIMRGDIVTMVFNMKVYSVKHGFTDKISTKNRIKFLRYLAPEKESKYLERFSRLQISLPGRPRSRDGSRISRQRPFSWTREDQLSVPILHSEFGRSGRALGYLAVSEVRLIAAGRLPYCLWRRYAALTTKERTDGSTKG
jgi:hypothetical protein